ncbi:tRNA pseudouridine synthase D [Lindgomyces ingoldianus]|uniref:tRNA pseudouridine synthase D n=1 Tax=Lindgomyces ingoldianus TaxID=673940 RepID=A0ACB6QSA8_9PLEO|nr:tRNA pseudouridine synthase D [Lindgomyces ingoldianus]KAF2469873.1 tRNA pseudouridine synthase D [Lindgomyces ingoldianus]
MASPLNPPDPDPDPESRPHKRPRLDNSNFPPATLAMPISNLTSEAEIDREVKVGITEYICPDNLGFKGVFKQRYTDFLVNEILPSGRVLELRSVGLGIEVKGKEGIKKGCAENEGAGVKERLSIVEKAEVEQIGDEGYDKENNGVEEMGEEKNGEDKNCGEKQSRDKNGVEKFFTIPENDLKMLHTILGEVTTAQIESLVYKIKKYPERKGRDFDAVVSSDPVINKDERTVIHETLRRLFPYMLESSMDQDQRMRVRPRPVQERGKKKGGKNPERDRGRDRHRGKVGWEELGGEYLHFTLYKENKDTMEVIGFLASKTGGMNNYGYAGTKDRRACSVQRVSVRRQTAERFAQLGRNLWNSAIGDFEHQDQKLDLGDLAGNQFIITLRDCHFDNEDGLDDAERLHLANRVISKSVQDFSEKGFINYFGLQRFGSFAATTDSVGKKLLRGNFEGAIDDILVYSESAVTAYDAKETTPAILISQDDKERAKAIHIWKTTKDGNNALRILPKRFSAESSIIQHLSSRNKGSGQHDRRTDYQGALRTIQRRLLTMYVHAYQSLVWNVVAGKRWATFGDKVVEGDLVLVHEHKDKEVNQSRMELDTVDQDGEVVINPSGADSAIRDEDRFERARPLSKEEAESGQYSIFDIVLPQPGFDVEYPKNAIGGFYKEFMASEQGGGLDPYDMRRKWRDISLSGGYRKFLARPLKELEFEVREYVKEDEQFVETDLQRVVKEQGIQLDWMKQTKTHRDGMQEGEKKLAVILKLQLGSSQYATMALRELMKKGVKAFQPEYMGGRG